MISLGSQLCLSVIACMCVFSSEALIQYNTKVKVQNAAQLSDTRTVTLNDHFLPIPIFHDDHSRARWLSSSYVKAYEIEPHNSTHYIWRGGSWTREFNPSGATVNLHSSQSWAWQHFFDNNLPFYFAFWPEVSNYPLSISQSSLDYDIVNMCNILKVKCDQNIPGSNPALTVWPEGPRPPMWHPDLTKKMRDTIFEQMGFTPPTKCSTYLWMPRMDGRNGRLTENVDAVEALFKRKYGDAAVTYHNSGLEDDIKAMASACLAVSPHGGGMIKTLFMPAGSHMVELQQGGKGYGIFWAMANGHGQNYHFTEMMGGQSMLEEAIPGAVTLKAAVNTHSFEHAELTEMVHDGQSSMLEDKELLDGPFEVDIGKLEEILDSITIA